MVRKFKSQLHTLPIYFIILVIVCATWISVHSYCWPKSCQIFGNNFCEKFGQRTNEYKLILKKIKEKNVTF